MKYLSLQILQYYNVFKQISLLIIIYNHNMQEEKIEEKQINFGRFSIFLLAKSAQTAYGIKNGDYLRYRRYCTRKVNKLRNAMNYKYGNRTRFVKKDITEEHPNDKRTLQITMFNAEKYWAYASQQKFAQTIRQEHKLRARFMAIKKFKRAYQWSQKLLKLCRDRTDSMTVSEAEAYGLYLQGLWYFEKQDWKTASSKLIGSREIISDLMQNIDTVSQKVYQQKIDQLDQTIKFCNFKLSKSDKLTVEEIIQIRKINDPSLSNLIESLTERRLKQVSLESQDEIRFGQQRYPMKVKSVIIQKSKIDAQLQNLQIIKQKSINQIADEQLYQQLLNYFGSVIILVDEAIRIVDSSKQDLKNYTQGQIDIFKKVSLLFEEIKINLLIDRNNTIFKHSHTSGTKNRKSAPQHLAKLLSNTTGLYGQLIDIQKQKAQGNTGSQHQNILKIDSKIFLVRTIRLMLVGQVYFNNQKAKQAYSLWNQCQRCLSSIKNSEEAAKMELMNLDQVSEIVRSGKLKCILKYYSTTKLPEQNLTKQMNQMKIEELINVSQLSLYKLATGKQSANLSLSEYSSLQIIGLPGDLTPIPTRPIFYDIYQSSISYPSLDGKLKKNQSGGWWKKLLGK